MSEKELTEAQIQQRRNAGRQSKTMTEAAMQQRQDASEIARDFATGPKTEDGKAASSRNAWKTGLHSEATRALTWQNIGAIGKPCKSTCKHFPCTLVEEGQTQPGKDCLDRTVYVEAFDSIMAAMHHGDIEYTRGLLASQVAGAVSLLQQLRDEIAERGLIIVKPYVTKAGELVYDAGGALAGEPMSNPLIPLYTKLLGELGLNLPELMATPRAFIKAEETEEGMDALTEAFKRAAVAGRSLSAGPGRTIIEGKAEAVDAGEQ